MYFLKPKPGDMDYHTMDVVWEDDDAESQEEEWKGILCSACNNIVTTPESQISINGSHTHVFANPCGLIFEIGCFQEAVGVICSAESSNEFSWFPDCLWRISVCRLCAGHLGWYFFSQHNSFHGLILEKLIFS